MSVVKDDGKEFRHFVNGCARVRNRADGGTICLSSCIVIFTAMKSSMDESLCTRILQKLNAREKGKFGADKKDYQDLLARRLELR